MSALSEDNFKMFAVVISLVGLGVVVAQLPVTPKPEQVVSDSVRFYYDPDSHYFVGATQSTCYMVALTRDEQDHILSSQGIEDIQLAMMREWLGTYAEKRIYHDDPSVPAAVAKWCASRDLFYLGRDPATLTTAKTPLTG